MTYDTLRYIIISNIVNSDYVGYLAYRWQLGLSVQAKRTKRTISRILYR